MAERLCYTVKNISVLTCAESSMAADSACLNGDKKSTEESVGTMKFNLMDNVVTRALTKICDMICLNVIWLICCIPIVTIGASTTALYSVMLKMVKNEEGYIFRSFFKAFKENFRQSTVIWLLFVLVSVIWWIDFNFAGALGGQAGRIPAESDLCAARICTGVGIHLRAPADCALCESDQRHFEKCTDSDARETAVYGGDVRSHGRHTDRFGMEHYDIDVCPADVVLFRRFSRGMDQFLYPAESVCNT